MTRQRSRPASSRSRRVLAGDIGGTKTVLAIAEVGPGNTTRIEREARFSSPAFNGLAPIVERFLAESGERPSAAGFGVPGPVIDGVCRTTNLPWLIDSRDLAAQLDLAGVALINDFAAAALGVLALPESSLAPLQRGVPVQHGNKAVIGAGTGLGHAVLMWQGRRYVAHASEAGHGGFAPQGALQRDLLAHLEVEMAPVVVEHVVSGPGLVRIYDFLVARGIQTSRDVRVAMADEEPGAVIARFANMHHDPACRQALDLFVQAYGAEAGSFALRTLAYGGVYLAGGIAPKILANLQRGGFVAAFCRRQKYDALLARIPVSVVLEPRVGLLGAALAAGGRA